MNDEPRKPGRKPLIETDEFKAAVASAVAQETAKAVAQLMTDLKEGRAAAGTKDDGSDQGWMKALAMEISQLTDQGTGRRRVAPEILRQRAEARDRMMKLIVDARAKNKIATYRVKAKTLLADRVVEPFWVDALHTAQPTLIDWAGVPNEAMAPENDVAEEIYKAFRDSIGSTEKVIPDEQLAVTPNGLVVHGGAAGISSGKRVVGGGEAPQTGASGDEAGLTVHHKNAPGRYVEKHVLGTIAEPARQSA